MHVISQSTNSGHKARITSAANFWADVKVARVKHVLGLNEQTGVVPVSIELGLLDLIIESEKQ